MNEGDKVEVLRNVGNLGPCWVEGVYMGKVDTTTFTHAVRLMGGDHQEIVHVNQANIRERKE